MALTNFSSLTSEQLTAWSRDSGVLLATCLS